MTRDQTPIQKLPHPKNPVNVNIRYGRDGDEVPEYECREAARFANYNWAEWLQLHWSERANSIAHYRMHHLIEAHIHEKSAADSKAKSGAGGARTNVRPAQPKRTGR